MSEERSRAENAEWMEPASPASAAPHAPVPEIACANCDKMVAAAHEHCPFCGARSHPERLTFRAIAETSVEHFFSLDIPLVRTFVDLFRFPGRVAGDYIAGKRKKYSNPLKYNLITAIVVVAMMRFVIAQLPVGASQPAFQQFKSSAGRLVAEGVLVSQRWHNDYLQIIYVVTLPAFALLLRVFLGSRSGRSIFDFYVMSLYAFGQVYLIQAACMSGTLLGFSRPLVMAISVVSGISPFVYIPWMTAGFTRISRWRSITMGLLAFLTFSIAVGVVLAALGVMNVYLTQGLPVSPAVP